MTTDEPLISLQKAYSREAIQGYVSSLAGAMFSKLYYADKQREVTIVPVYIGALHFSSDFLRCFSDSNKERMIVHVEPIKLQNGNEIVEDITRQEFVRGRPVIVLEDALASGKSLLYVGEHVKRMEPTFMYAGVVLRKMKVTKEDGDQVYSPIDFSMWQKIESMFKEISVGFNAPDGTYVGYGMDLGNQYRWGADISLLSEDQVAAFKRGEHERELAFMVQNIEESKRRKGRTRRKKSD